MMIGGKNPNSSPIIKIILYNFGDIFEYSPRPAQTPAITLFFSERNGFDILSKKGFFDNLVNISEVFVL